MDLFLPPYAYPPRKPLQFRLVLIKAACVIYFSLPSIGWAPRCFTHCHPFCPNSSPSTARGLFVFSPWGLFSRDERRRKNIIARFPTVFQLPSIIMRSKPCLITPSGRVVISLSRILMCQSDLLLPPPTLLYAPRAGPFGQQGPSEIGYNQFVVATPVGQFPRPDLCIFYFVDTWHCS